MIPALGTQKQKDLCKFKASLIYTVSSRKVSTIKGNRLKNKQTNK